MLKYMNRRRTNMEEKEIIVEPTVNAEGAIPKKLHGDSTQLETGYEVDE